MIQDTQLHGTGQLIKQRGILVRLSSLFIPLLIASKRIISAEVRRTARYNLTLRPRSNSRY